VKASQSFKNGYKLSRVVIVMILLFSQLGWTVSRSSATAVLMDKNAGRSAVYPIISGNAGIAGAIITYTGGSTTADLSGSYSFTVPIGWVGTVTPSLPGYTFIPPNRIYVNVVDDQPDQDYLATANSIHRNYLPLIRR
jgi:hypothetical protein